VKRFSALLSSALLLVAGCSREEAPARPEADLDFGPVAVSCAYIALVEKPDAARVFLLGDQAKRLRRISSGRAFGLRLRWTGRLTSLSFPAGKCPSDRARRSRRT